ncbi:hypothetical protein [Parasphingorhabdus pacifica]
MSLCGAYFASSEIVFPGKDTVRLVALVLTEEHWNLKRRVQEDDSSDNDEQGAQQVYRKGRAVLRPSGRG